MLLERIFRIAERYGRGFGLFSVGTRMLRIYDEFVVDELRTHGVNVVGHDSFDRSA